MPPAPLGERIARAFPAIGPVEPLRKVGDGVRSDVFETSGGFVVKVARVPGPTPAYEPEWRSLPVLAPHVSVAIPRPRWRSLAGEVFPYGALAYPMLRGHPPPEHGSDGLARDLGKLLAALHALPRSVASEAGLPEWEPRARYLELRPAVMEELAHRLTPAQCRHIDAWWDDLAGDPAFPTADRAICHHDVWHDNILVNEHGRLAAILDWEHVDWSDPAHDLAPLLHFGEPFFEAAVAAYREAGGRYDDGLAYRVERYWPARAMGGLSFSLRHETEAEVLDQVRKVSEIFFGLSPRPHR